MNLPAKENDFGKDSVKKEMQGRGSEELKDTSSQPIDCADDFCFSLWKPSSAAGGILESSKNKTPGQK